jgi:hypothetical protein
MQVSSKPLFEKSVFESFSSRSGPISDNAARIGVRRLFPAGDAEMIGRQTRVADTTRDANRERTDFSQHTP